MVAELVTRHDERAPDRGGSGELLARDEERRSDIPGSEHRHEVVGNRGDRSIVERRRLRITGIDVGNDLAEELVPSRPRELPESARMPTTPATTTQRRRWREARCAGCGHRSPPSVTVVRLARPFSKSLPIILSMSTKTTITSYIRVGSEHGPGDIRGGSLGLQHELDGVVGLERFEEIDLDG